MEVCKQAETKTKYFVELTFPEIVLLRTVLVGVCGSGPLMEFASTFQGKLERLVEYDPPDRRFVEASEMVVEKLQVRRPTKLHLSQGWL
jgi:hypothetical protein